MADPRTHRLAYVGRDGQLHVLHVDASGARKSQQLTWSLQASPLSLWGGQGDGTTTLWPCWSPDGRSIACFVDVPSAEPGPRTHVAVVEADGVHEHRLPPLEHRLPIHVQWSPNGARIGVLVQFEEQLELWVAEARPTPGPLRLVAEGSPLFFGWADGGDRVVLHVGDSADEPARVEVRDLVGDGDDIVFRVPPSNFCVPFTVDCEGEERVLYVIQRDHESQLVSARIDGEDILGLGVLHGLVALVPTPDGAHVAFTAAPDADGSPYDGIRTVSCDGRAAPEHAVDAPVLAFFWRRDHPRPMWVQWDAGRQHIRWMVPRENSEPIEVGRCRPTRDQYFHLHFFEQFARSHAPCSADGRWLVWAGHDTHADTDGPRVFLTDLHADTPEPTAVCAGSYAVFAPC